LTEDSVRNAPLDVLATANAIVLRPSCNYLDKAKSEVPRQFKVMRVAGDVDVWIRQ